jgi:soluble lytic murein transglycosylase
MADSDKALQPLMSYEVSDDDIKALEKVVELALRSKFSEAQKYRDQLKHPVAQKFARWYFYRRKAPDTHPAEIVDFLNENPLWPGREDVAAAAEDALFWREESADRIISYFAGNEPATGTGLAALGSALIEKGRKEEGVKRVQQAWRLHVLTPATEKTIRKLKVLEAEDHYARASFLLMQDSKKYVGAVKRILPLIGKDRQSAVKAHMAAVQRAGNAGTLLTNLDAGIKDEPAILLARAQYLRRAKNDAKARELLTSAPKSAEALLDPEEWWKERQRHIREALNDGDAATAYALASGPNDGLEHWDLSEAEFMAGWIAFRFLNKPEAARKHFAAAAAAGGLPKRRSRASYWLGRIESAAGNQDEARARYMEAAEHHHTFYGQLAHQMIAGPDARLKFRHYPRPTKQDIDEFVGEDAIQAMVIAEKAGFDNLLALFMYDLAREIDSAPKMILLCELASRIAPPHATVRMAKIAINRDFPVEHYAYPRALPEFSVIASGQDTDEALIHALTRQESEFNPSIVSSAGAVGLMQLLPSTAKFVARQHNVDYTKNRLSSDPAYNVSLGSAFLHQLISNYDGSYIMALAGYNAGPGRVSRWAKELGDPRNSKVDPVDWIERIPFTETRDYVHKILESVQVYRSRLLDENAPIRLAEDLHRGRKDRPEFMAIQASN